MENPHEQLIMSEYEKSVLLLQLIWKEIGCDFDNREKRLSRITEKIKILLSNVLDEERDFRKILLNEIDKNGKHFYILNKELGAGIADPADDLSLLELEHFLRQNVESMKKEVKKRHVHIKELQNKEQELCERLIEEPTDVPNKTVPSKEIIEDLERKIRTLEQEKISREKTFHYLQSRLLKLVEDLEMKANCSFERDILSDVELFTLSQQNLQKMKEMKDEYEIKVKENERVSHNLGDRITLLWNRLEVEQQERDSFLSGAIGHTPSTLLKLHEELERLNIKQQQNIGTFINKLRREIEEWWEKCYIGEAERNQFLPYISDEYSEEVLQAHDKEVQRLNQFYSDSKAIFAKIGQRQKIWLKYVDLEERANDPNRFGNRGCSLLKEEKERKFVKKELPEIEKELENTVLAWETHHGRTFYISGLQVSEFLENEWIQYHDKKELEKKKKQHDRIHKLHYESRMGSKPPAVKRRMANNEMLRKSKLQRVNEDQPLHLMSSTNLKNTTRIAALQERNQNSMGEGSEQSSSESSTYSRFAEGIQLRSEKENMRSSAVLGINKTLILCRPSPHRPPIGLPKTPKSVPRPPSRCSPRLSGTCSARRSSRNLTASRIAFSPSSLGRSRNISTRLNFSPSSSPLFKSPRAGSSQSGTPSKWNKRTFLM